MRTSSRFVSVIAVAGLTLAACGGGSDDAADTDSGTEVDAEPADDAPADDGADDAPADDAAGDETVADDAGGDEAADDGGDAAGAAVAVSLVEWAIEAPAEYEAGAITFSATNNGQFPHEFQVIQAESYESLPLEESGAVIEGELPTGAIIGSTGTFGAGQTQDLTVELAPGNYVLVCNLGAGGNSHAGLGQRLDITVG